MPDTHPTTANVTRKVARVAAPGTGHSRGQVLVLFALLLTFLLGTAAFVVDLAWIWVNELKVQRAADAAALAGVVHLPGAVALANSSALEETNLNGYRDSTNSAAQQASQAVDVPKLAGAFVKGSLDAASLMAKNDTGTALDKLADQNKELIAETKKQTSALQALNGKATKIAVVGKN